MTAMSLKIAAAAAALLIPALAGAQHRPYQNPEPYPQELRDAVKFVYDADFAMNFDNREYDVSGFQTSETIFGARLTPAIGLQIGAGHGQTHRIMAAIDVMKDFGDPSAVNGELFHELKFWYSFRQSLRKGGSLEMTAGIFPKSMSGEEWSTAFFSEKSRWYDNNMEGALFRWSRPDAALEFACDWNGKIGAGADTREQFMIMSAGHKDFGIWRIGYNGYGVHFANSEVVKGVVDNILAEPYVRVDLTGATRWFFSKFHVRAGWLQSLQQDRRLDTGFEASGLAELTVELRKWGFGLTNSLYAGKDIMPYFAKTDEGGILYGERLYFGDQFFRLNSDGSGDSHFYDRAELSWMPEICPGVNLGAAVVFHFGGDGLLGNQETFRLSVNLHDLILGLRRR